MFSVLKDEQDMDLALDSFKTQCEKLMCKHIIISDKCYKVNSVVEIYL